MENVVLIIHLLLALALIGVVLLQRSEGGGLGMGSGGGAISQRAAATALGMRHLRAELDDRPVHIIGYSTGAALALARSPASMRCVIVVVMRAQPLWLDCCAEGSRGPAQGAFCAIVGGQREGRIVSGEGPPTPVAVGPRGGRIGCIASVLLHIIQTFPLSVIL